MDLTPPFAMRPPSAPHTPSRRSLVLSRRWRRILAVVAVALVAAACYLGARDVLTSTWQPAYRFTSSLNAGTVLVAEQLESIRLPPGVMPPEAIADATALIGKSLARRVGAGDFATVHHVSEPGQWPAASATSRLMSIPLTSELPDAAVGVTVDLISAADATILGSAVVVSFPTAAPTSGLLGAPTNHSYVVVSVEVAAVGKIARALASAGGVSVAVHPATPRR